MWDLERVCSDKTFVAKATNAQMEQREEDRQRRWKDGLGLFSMLSELNT